ncbi:13110_t:CDS:1, partial [Cetraspora pellucida]
RNPKPMKSTNKSTKRQQLESPTSEHQVIPNNNLLSPKFLDDLSDIDMNSPIFNLDLFTDWTDFFNNQNTYPSPDLSIISSGNSSPSSNDLDFPIQQVDDDIVNNLLFISENQSPIYDSQYGLGIFDFSNANDEISLLNPHEIFDIQNNYIVNDLVNSNDQLSFLPNLSNTTINHDNLSDALIAYEMGFNYPI